MTYSQTPCASIRFQASHVKTTPGTKAQRSPDRNGIVRNRMPIIPAMIAATFTSHSKNAMSVPLGGSQYGA